MKFGDNRTSGLGEFVYRILLTDIRQMDDRWASYLFVCLFVALRPKSTAMVIAGRSVQLTTLFPGQA